MALLSNDTCQEWQGHRRADGYGFVWVAGVGRRYAHRVAYCKAHGLKLEQIKGLVVRHRCDNPACVNPQHLEIGAQADNIADAVSRGRNAKRTVHGRAKLTEAQISAIRAEYTGFKGQQVMLAAKYDVSQPMISYIVNRKNWTGKP